MKHRFTLWIPLVIGLALTAVGCTGTIQGERPRGDTTGPGDSAGLGDTAGLGDSAGQGDSAGDSTRGDTAGGDSNSTTHPEARLLGRGEIFMASRIGAFHFTNGASYTTAEVEAALTERFNRYYTDADWIPSRTIYVGPNGTAPINANTASNPSSVATAVAELGPGDRIFFLAGSYESVNIWLDSSHSGNYDEPVVFVGERAADGTPLAVLNCSTTGGTNQSMSCFNLEHAHYIAVHGFELSGGRYGIRAVGGYTTTDHILGIAMLDNVGHHACSDPFFTGEASWLVVQGNKAHHSGHCPTGNTDGHGVYLSNGGDFVIFRWNELWGNMSSDFQINSDPISTCAGAGDLDTADICDGNAFNDSHGKGISEFYWIEGNYLHNGDQAGPNMTGVRNSVLKGNVMAFMAAHGISFWQESNLTEPSGLNPDLGSRYNLVQENLFLNDPRTASSGGRHVLALSRFAEHNEFRSNIIAAGRVEGQSLVADNSVVLVGVSESSDNNTFDGNCLWGSDNFEEDTPGAWPRTLGEDWTTSIDAAWFASFPADKMGAIENWNITPDAPEDCPRLEFSPLP